MADEDQKEWVKGIIGRMCEAYGLEGKDLKGQLASKLGLNGSGTVKSWVYNKRIPFHAMVTCKHDVDCSLDWLLSGKSPVVVFDGNIREMLHDKLVEHLFNAGRYKLVDSAEGIEVTAGQMMEEIEKMLSLSFMEQRKAG